MATTTVTNVQIYAALQAMGYAPSGPFDPALTVGNQHSEFMNRMLANYRISSDDFAKAETVATRFQAAGTGPMSPGDVAAIIQNAAPDSPSLKGTITVDPTTGAITTGPSPASQQTANPVPAQAPKATPAPAAPPAPSPAAPAPPATDARSQTIAIQQALNAKGAGLTVDGLMGPKTKAAMAKYAGGGVAGTPAPAGSAAVKLAPNASYADTVAFYKANYGYAAWVLDDPELQPIFKQAAAAGWDKARLLGALSPTQFWQTHSDTQRLKINEKSGDPATYQLGVAGSKAEVVAEAGRQGLTIDPARLDQIATDAYNSGWKPNQITAAVGAEFHYNSKAANQPGEVGNLKAIAGAYLVPLDDATIQQWGTDILTGKVTDAEFTEHMKGIAKGLFPTMAKSIDAGQTVTQLVAPYKSTIASTLEIDPNSVDFMDPKWSRLLTAVDPKTNQPTTKPLYDTMTELRTNPIYNYDKTSTAKASGAQFSQMLGQAWGVS